MFVELLHKGTQWRAMKLEGGVGKLVSITFQTGDVGESVKDFHDLWGAEFMMGCSLEDSDYHPMVPLNRQSSLRHAWRAKADADGFKPLESLVI
jgi:hypothetical protein